jgi:hypothetical protein
VEHLASTARVADGQCHGQLCRDALVRLVRSRGLEADWIDWRFPSVDWVLS